jgi:hypothetical protein
MLKTEWEISSILVNDWYNPFSFAIYKQYLMIFLANHILGNYRYCTAPFQTISVIFSRMAISLMLSVYRAKTFLQPSVSSNILSTYLKRPNIPGPN